MFTGSWLLFPALLLYCLRGAKLRASWHEGTVALSEAFGQVIGERSVVKFTRTVAVASLSYSGAAAKGLSFSLSFFERYRDSEFPRMFSASL